MKILLTHRYFWPDTPPYANILRTLATHFADEGHEVRVFASYPSYGKIEKGAALFFDDRITINRVRTFQETKSNIAVRLFNTMVYCIALFLHIIRIKPDVVTAATFPPVIAGWVASLAAKIIGAKFVYHMQDIHPEVSHYSGGLMQKRPLQAAFRWFDNQTLRRASAIIVLSQDMKNTLERRRLAGTLPIYIINNMLLSKFAEAAAPPPDYAKAADKKRIIFAGNMGRFQRLDVIVPLIVAAMESDPRLELMLMGDGEMRPALERQWGQHAQVQFAPFLPFETAATVMADADIGLVSLAKDIYAVSYPSKILSYLGLGLPVLTFIEPHSGIAQEVTHNGIGATPAHETAASVGEAIASILSSPDVKQAVAQYYQDTYRHDAILAEWDRMLHAIAS